jgi:threonine aldolase
MTPEIRIDLVSDTATKPSHGMREAMARAQVGDEQRGEDPSTNVLCERVAEMLGKEEAMFLPSGTMCNQIAIAVHCQRGDEILAAENAHIVGSEGAGAAVFAGSLIRTVPSKDGIFDGEALQSVLRKPRRKSPRSRLVNVEQTINRGGGTIWPSETLNGVAQVTKENDLSLHMDGARLFNACVESGVEAKRYARECDSVWLDLSKGLGCPVGGVLAGSRAFIENAWGWKYRFGGGMRQSGILAAAGLYALDHNIARLKDDHENARHLAYKLKKIPGIELEFEETPTNLVFFDVSGTGQTADKIAEQLLLHGVRIGVETDERMRAVTHLDVDRGAIDDAVEVLSQLAETSDAAVTG